MRALLGAVLLMVTACSPQPEQDARAVSLADRVVAIVDVDEAFAPTLSRVIEDEVVKLLGPQATPDAPFAARDVFLMIGTLDRSERADGATVLTMVWTVERPRGGLPFTFTVATVPEVRNGRVTRAEIRGLAWLSAFDFMAHPQVQSSVNR
jgi:hypothetical protein